MGKLRFTIADEIFQRFPGYIRGVVVAHEVTNHVTPADLAQMLRDAEESVRLRLNLEHLAEDPRIRSWREAFRSFGAKPSEFRSSIEGLARRILRNDPLPTINALVDIGNIVSLKYLIPAGGHAIDVLSHDICLRLATGRESFTALGSEHMENPLPGEVIFAEGDTVLTRRWTWRQAKHSLTVPETRAIEFNLDGLPPVRPEEIELACVDMTEMVRRFCGGSIRHELLTAGNPAIEL